MSHVAELGVDLIRAERERQITDEGYTPEHDREHDSDQFIEAAIAYAMAEPRMWPWEVHGFKPEVERSSEYGTVRDLVKAGALIAAAIDRRLAAESEAVSA